MKCINLDWLEIHCIEYSGEMTPEYFRRDFKVTVRNYGTPQYAQMFTLSKHGVRLLEIRRLPYSLRSRGGIFDDGSCHIRLCNEVCYWHSPIAFLLAFIKKYRYQFVNITRADIALDFQQFDGLPIKRPRLLIEGYFGGLFAKVNQTNIAAHGRSQWDGTTFNSIKWGSEKSMITTKLYNKTLELREVKEKDHIRAAWLNAGFDPTEDVWRIEFSLKSFGQFIDEDGLILDNDLTSYDTREKILYIFYCLTARYFHFKENTFTRTGRRQRRDRCPDLELFDLTDYNCIKPTNAIVHRDPTRMQKVVANWLQEQADCNYDREEAYHFRMSADFIRGKGKRVWQTRDEKIIDEPLVDMVNEIGAEQDMYNLFAACDSTL